MTLDVFIKHLIKYLMQLNESFACLLALYKINQLFLLRLDTKLATRTVIKQS